MKKSYLTALLPALLLLAPSVATAKSCKISQPIRPHRSISKRKSQAGSNWIEMETAVLATVTRVARAKNVLKKVKNKLGEYIR